MIYEGCVGVPSHVSIYAIVVWGGEVRKSVADAGIVAPDNGSCGASSRTTDRSERRTVLFWCGSETAAEAFEVGSVKFSTEFACNKIYNELFLKIFELVWK